MSHLAGLGIASFVMSVFGVIVTFLPEIIAFVTKSAKEKSNKKKGYDGDFFGKNQNQGRFVAVAEAGNASPNRADKQWL